MVRGESWMQGGVRIDLDNLRTYIIELSEALNSKTGEFVAKVESQAASMAEDERDEWYEWNSDTHWQLTDVFPTILQNSLLVSTDSYLESVLSSIVRHMERDQPNQIKVKDLRGVGIDLYSAYLKKVQGVDFPDKTPEWQAITIYHKVRNFIVHNDRKLDDSKNAQAIRNFVKGHPTFIKINQFDQISVTVECNINFVDTVNHFLTDLFRKIDY